MGAFVLKRIYSATYLIVLRLPSQLVITFVFSYLLLLDFVNTHMFCKYSKLLLLLVRESARLVPGA